MSANFWSSVPNKDSYPVLSTSKTRIVGATQRRSKPVRQCVHLTFELEGKPFSSILFVVPDLSCDILLGIDWVVQNRIVLDILNCKLCCHTEHGHIDHEIPIKMLSNRGSQDFSDSNDKYSALDEYLNTSIKIAHERASTAIIAKSQRNSQFCETSRADALHSGTAEDYDDLPRSAQLTSHSGTSLPQCDRSPETDLYTPVYRGPNSDTAFSRTHSRNSEFDNTSITASECQESAIDVDPASYKECPDDCDHSVKTVVHDKDNVGSDSPKRGSWDYSSSNVLSVILSHHTNRSVTCTSPLLGDGQNRGDALRQSIYRCLTKYAPRPGYKLLDQYHVLACPFYKVLSGNLVSRIPGLFWKGHRSKKEKFSRCNLALVPYEFFRGPGFLFRIWVQSLVDYDRNAPCQSREVADADKETADGVLPHTRPIYKVNRTDIDYTLDDSNHKAELSLDDIKGTVQSINTLSKSEKDDLTELLYINRDIFSEKPGLTEKYIHTIEVIDHSPFKGKIYPVPFAYRQKVREQINKMLEWGIIERSNTCYVNSLVTVLKKDGNVRICLDARELNKRVTVDFERVPLPEEILQRYERLTHISTIDLVQSYWQVPLRPEDRKYTGFLFDSKTYHFKVIPFGLNTAVAGFTRCMDIVLGPNVGSFTVAYVDDLLVISSSFSDHISHLQQVFTKIREAGMTLNFKKSCFCRTEVKFLGYVLSTRGISPDPKRIEAVQKFGTPRNVKQLQSFLGLCNFDRRFCHNYANLTQPLMGLLKKGRKWSWSQTEQTAFDSVKQAFLHLNQLTHPTADKPYFVNTDSSEKAIGAVLYQYNDDGERCVLAYASRLLRPAECNYSTTEREALAVVWALQRWRVYLLGVPVTVETDHEALSFLARCPTYNARILRWVLTLQEYHLSIKYISGKANFVADTLSRPVDAFGSRDKLISGKENLFWVNRVVEKALQLPRETTKKLKNISKYQREDAILGGIIDRVVSNSGGQSNFCVKNNVLFVKHPGSWRICLPEKLLDEIILGVHETYGHVGVNKTLALLNAVFSYPLLAKAVRNIVSKCLLCLKSKYPNSYLHGSFTAIIPESPNDIVAVDIFGPLPRSAGGVTNVLVVLNVFTKYVKLYALRKATARAVFRRIKDNYFVQMGKPKRILSDHGTQFTSHIWIDGLKNEGVRVIYSSIRHPQSNPSERVMRELGRILRAYVYERHTNWAKWLPLAEIWMNHNVHDAIGCTPHELQFHTRSYHPVVAIMPDVCGEGDPISYEELQEAARDKILKAADSRRRRHDKRYVSTQLQVGELVLLRSNPISSAADRETKKLALLYKGPYRIKEVIANNAYRLEDVESGVEIGIHNIVNLRKIPV